MVVANRVIGRSARFLRRLSSQEGRAMAGTSRVNREVYARFCGRLEVKFLRPTRRLQGGDEFVERFEGGCLGDDEHMGFAGQSGDRRRTGDRVWRLVGDAGADHREAGHHDEIVFALHPQELRKGDRSAGARDVLHLRGTDAAGLTKHFFHGASGQIPASAGRGGNNDMKARHRLSGGGTGQKASGACQSAAGSRGTQKIASVHMTSPPLGKSDVHHVDSGFSRSATPARHDFAFKTGADQSSAVTGVFGSCADGGVEGRWTGPISTPSLPSAIILPILSSSKPSSRRISGPCCPALGTSRRRPS